MDLKTTRKVTMTSIVIFVMFQVETSRMSTAEDVHLLYTYLCTCTVATRKASGLIQVLCIHSSITGDNSFDGEGRAREE